MVYAKTAPELGAKGITAFCIEKGMEGFRYVCVSQALADKEKRPAWLAVCIPSLYACTDLTATTTSLSQDGAEVG